MQALHSRIRRNTDLVGDLNLFRTKDQAYLKFINSLVSRLTEPNERYGQIKVTKRDDDITKVTIKDSGTNTQVEFTYRNRDLYIVGLVVGNTFYVDSEAYGTLGKKIPNDWKSVINAPNTVEVRPFIYGNILPKGDKTELQIAKLGESLQELVQIGNKSKRIDIMRDHLSPFVVTFAEAIRFPVIAREVQEVIRKPRGTLKLSKNLVRMLSLGHPDERTPNYVFTIYSLMMSWGKLSDRVPALYGDPPQSLPPVVKDQYALNLDKTQLSTLLGVASSQNFAKTNVGGNTRGKRDISLIPNVDSMEYDPTLLDHQIDYIDYDGNLQGDHPRPSVGVSSVTHAPDVIGALQLLAVGMLYLGRKKLNIPLGNVERYRDPRDALVVAVDISERMRCFLRSAAFELEVSYEEELELQRQIARALIRGNGLESIYGAFLEQHYSDAEGHNDSLETLRKQLVEALANESGSIQNYDYRGNECFK